MKHAILIITVLLSLTACSSQKNIPVEVVDLQGDPTSERLNPGITSPKVVADTKAGTITISFDWNDKKAKYPAHTMNSVKVGLFDKNDRELASFAAPPFRDVVKGEGTHYEAAFQANTQLLEHLKSAKIGATAG